MQNCNYGSQFTVPLAGYVGGGWGGGSSSAKDASYVMSENMNSMMTNQELVKLIDTCNWNEAPQATCLADNYVGHVVEGSGQGFLEDIVHMIKADLVELKSRSEVGRDDSDMQNIMIEEEVKGSAVTVPSRDMVEENNSRDDQWNRDKEREL